MFVYLSKKIQIPRNVTLRALDWNGPQGWIACGGDSALLKVLKLEAVKSADQSLLQQGLAAPTTLPMNQTLDGHDAAIRCITWNEKYRRLTTSDTAGDIIVWMLHKGVWYQEMINNRKVSSVAAIKWNRSGEKVAIVYEDGAVIVGSVTGDRIWMEELPDAQLTHVLWSPDEAGRHLIFGLKGGEVRTYDAHGNFVAKVPNVRGDYNFPEMAELAAMDWYQGERGYADPQHPTLAILYEDGIVQLMRDEHDEEGAVCVDTQLQKATHLNWNPFGTLFAVAGLMKEQKSGGDGESGGGDGLAKVVMFFKATGDFVRTLRVPSPSPISGLAWDGNGLRLALACASFIYFGNVRPQYMWGYFANTLVFAFVRADRPEYRVVFWDTKSTGKDERHPKYVKGLQSVHAAGEHCLLVTRLDLPADPTDTDESGATVSQWILIVCNAIGTPIDSQYLDFEPTAVSMSPYHIAVSADDHVFVWQFRTLAQKSALASFEKSVQNRNDGPKKGRGNKENQAAAVGMGSEAGAGVQKLFHADDPEAKNLMGGDAQGEDASAAQMKTGDSTISLGGKRPKRSHDPVCSLALSPDCLIVGRESGKLQRYKLPDLSPEATYQTDFGERSNTPTSLALNANSTWLSAINPHGFLTLIQIGSTHPRTPDKVTPFPTGKQVVAEFMRKDVWDLHWADDSPSMFSIMEKTRMYIFRQEVPVDSDGNGPSKKQSITSLSWTAEEGIVSSGYVCQFKNLKVKSVLLDEVMRYTTALSNPNARNSSANHNSRNAKSKGGSQSAGKGDGTKVVFPDLAMVLVTTETKSLRDTRLLIETEGLGLIEAFKFATANPHPRLWRLIAEEALLLHDFVLAERCFVLSRDYQGLLFVKRLKRLDDRAKQRAEIKAHCKEFDEAERIYKSIDRRDLAIDLRCRLGDWFRVVQLIQQGSSGGPSGRGGETKASRDGGPPKKSGKATASAAASSAAAAARELNQRAANTRAFNAGKGGDEGGDGTVSLTTGRAPGGAVGGGMIAASGAADDSLLIKAWGHIGDYYMERFRYRDAVQYFEMCQNNQKLVQCLYALSDFDALELLAKKLDPGANPEDKDLLAEIGDKLARVGQGTAAVNCLVRAGDISRAVDACIALNKWDAGLQLAKHHDISQMELLLAKYAAHLLSNGKALHVVELFRKAGRHIEAAKVLFRLGGEAGNEQRLDRAKKLYVLGALEVEHHRDIARNGARRDHTATVQGAAQSALAALVADESNSATKDASIRRFMENSWRGAEAYHFLMLCQRQLYNREVDAAMKTALRLGEYDDLLRMRDVYSMIALTAYFNKHFSQCSRAFIRLETLPLAVENAPSSEEKFEMPSAADLAPTEDGGNGQGATLNLDGNAFERAAAKAILDGVSQHVRDAFRDLSVQIFTRTPPRDPPVRSKAQCPNQSCKKEIRDHVIACPHCAEVYPGCVVSGRPIFQLDKAAQCRVCRHYAFQHEVASMKEGWCPLCHHYNFKTQKSRDRKQKT